jgi:hypothetical protein
MAFCNRYICDYESKIPLEKSNYAEINTDSCATHSMANVQNKAECELAVTSLGLQDTTAREVQISGRPHGCIYASNNWLQWYSPDGSSYPSGDCGTVQFGAKYACICRLPGKHNF